MKFVVSSTALLNVLQTSNKVVSNKNTLPILDNFLFELKDGVLKITASDLETTMIGTLKVDSMEQEGVIAAPVKLMIDSLKEFSEQPLTIEANESTWEIQISWKTGKLAIPGTSGLSYPTQPALDEETKQEISVDTNLLLTGINKTIFATADDELRPVMNGVYVNIEPQAITFVATDAHKLVKYAASAETGTTASFILPKKPANLLRGVLGKEDADIRMEFDDKNVVFHLKNHTLVCRLIEGNYPNYNAVIPANNPNKVLVDRTELLNAQDLDFSVSAQESLTCDYEGEAIEIGFRSTFLVEILSNIETQNVSVELADSTRAGVFKPVYDEAPDTETLMLLMPMMINA